jgi:hypothetical protein
VRRAIPVLLAARAERVRPGLDDKVLTEWNALFLATLAEAAAATANPRWLAAAIANGDFLIDNLRGDDGRWRRSWQSESGPRHLAYGADYAALMDAFVRLGEASGQARWIETARETADALVELFWDDDQGGVFTTGSDAERLVTRPKDLLDNATPSANSLAANALLRLAALTGESQYRTRAETIVSLLAEPAGRHPMAFGHLLCALDLLVSGAIEVAVTGERPDLVAAVQARYLPNAVLTWGERYDSPLWEAREDGKAYVCRNYACLVPAADPETLVSQLTTA